jgi:hypothetical protein
MGGTDDPDNLIKLTVEEHAEAHRLLYEKYGNEFDKIAWLGLTKSITKQEAMRLAQSEGGKKKKPPRSKEHKEKLSKAGMGRIVSNETRKKLVKASTGVKRSEETRKKMSDSHKGQRRPHTEDAKRKISEARRRRVLVDSVSKLNQQSSC